MNVFENFYLSYYFLVRKDKYLSKTGRVRFLIEMVLLMLCVSVLFMIYGTLNIRTDNLKTISILIFTALVITHWAWILIYGKGKEQEYIKSSKKYDLKKKRVYSLFGLLSVLLSFAIMIFSAILMSYLWSLELVNFF